jgi:methionyl-tRNA synthetase
MADVQANKMFTDLEPWYMKDASIPIAYAYDALRIAGILLQPFLPHKATELLDRLGIATDKRSWADATWNGREEVDALALKAQLQASAKEWKGKGYLFPKVEVAPKKA